MINNELKRLNVDIAALQETRLADSGTLKEKDFTYYWQGKTSDERREHGVGFAVKNSLLSMVEPDSNGSEGLLTLRLNWWLYHPRQRVFTNTVLHSRCIGRVLREPRIHYQDYPQPRTTCSPRRLQRQRGLRSRLVAFLPRPVWRGQNEQERTASTEDAHLLWSVHHQPLFQNQTTTQSFLETPSLQTLAPTRSDPGQTYRHQERSPLTFLSQCGLQ